MPKKYRVVQGSCMDPAVYQAKRTLLGRLSDRGRIHRLTLARTLSSRRSAYQPPRAGSFGAPATKWHPATGTMKRL